MSGISVFVILLSVIRNHKLMVAFEKRDLFKNPATNRNALKAFLAITEGARLGLRMTVNV